MPRNGTRSYIRNAVAAAGLAAACALLGCSSDPPPPPELTPNDAAAAILQKWAQNELDHFPVTFHSDTLIECGVRNGLWKLVDFTDRDGKAWSSMYQLTDKGKQILASIHLEESGRGHRILFKGPYRLEITSIAEGSRPNTRAVGFRWDIDWDKAPAELKECVARFEMSGNEVAVFQLDGVEWKLASYLKYMDTDDANAQPAPTGTQR